MAMRTIVHHLYRDAGDLLPVCGKVPGPDERDQWHTGHVADYLVAYKRVGHPCCTLCCTVALTLLDDRGNLVA